MRQTQRQTCIQNTSAFERPDKHCNTQTHKRRQDTSCDIHNPKHAHNTHSTPAHKINTRNTSTLERGDAWRHPRNSALKQEHVQAAVSDP